MAAINLLVKDFVQKRVPGGTEQVLVFVPDPIVGDSQNAASTSANEWQVPWDGQASVTVYECLIYGGIPVAGFCSLSNTTSNGSFTQVTSSKLPVSDYSFADGATR